MARKRSWSRSAAWAAAGLSLATLLAAQDAGPRSIREGVFSEKQVRRGQRIYEKVCIECHLQNEFTAPTFLASWHGQPVHRLFAQVRATMPENNPGGLKRREYAEVLAFIFSLNNLPAGTDDMENDDKSLKQILIERPDSEDEGSREL